MNINQENIQNFISSFLPIRLWQAQKGVGSFLTFDMGDQISITKKNGEKKIRGTLHIWVYLCDWVLILENKEILSSDVEDEDSFRPILNRLQGISLIGIAEKDSDAILELNFDNNYKLVINPNLSVYDHNDDLVIFYLHGHDPIAYSAKNKFYFEAKDI